MIAPFIPFAWIGISIFYMLNPTEISVSVPPLLCLMMSHLSMLVNK